MKTVAFAFGRLNPPTIAHNLLVNKISEQEAEPRLYLSHSCDPKKNPLSYEKKLYWCQQAFGDMVNVKESSAKNMYEVMTELWHEGFTDVIYLCGSDRVEEAERLKAYNGIKDKKGNILYEFNSIKIVKVGNDRINEDDVPIEMVSASMQRKFAAENDLESFKMGCPEELDEDQRTELFYDVREGMRISEELVEESEQIEESKSNQGENEYLIADAYNNLNDDSKFFHRIGKKLANSIGYDLKLQKLKNGDGYYVTNKWVKAGLYGDKKPNNTPKTDLISNDDKYRISLKEGFGGSQLMSAKFDTTGSEALATLNAALAKTGDRYTLDDILNVSPKDDNINGTFNVNELLQSYYDDKMLYAKGIRVGDIKNGKAGSEEQTRKFNEISKQLKRFANKLQKLCNNDEEFREAFLREAATGEVKFGADSRATANCWLVYYGNKYADFYNNWEDFYKGYLNTHKVTIQVTFKSSSGSAPYITIRIIEK